MIFNSTFRFTTSSAAVASAFSLRSSVRMDDAMDAMLSCAEAGGLGFVIMHDGIFKQRIQPLNFLNRFVSLWHRHRLYQFNAEPCADRQLP